jgi:hypothetical protein
VEGNVEKVRLNKGMGQTPGEKRKLMFKDKEKTLSSLFF